VPICPRFRSIRDDPHLGQSATTHALPDRVFASPHRFRGDETVGSYCRRPLTVSAVTKEGVALPQASQRFLGDETGADRGCQVDPIRHRRNPDGAGDMTARRAKERGRTRPRIGPLSDPLCTMHTMRTLSSMFDCHWCGVEFPRRCPTGRRPLYCRQTCRQRAFEHRRRGAFVAGLPAVPASLPVRREPPAYEMGKGWAARHALRPDGVPDRTGARPTLCGARARRVPQNFQPRWRGAHDGMPLCRTCQAIDRRHPAGRVIDPANDLPVMTALVGRLRADFAKPGADFRPGVSILLALVGLPGGVLRGTSSVEPLSRVV
jgi:hypothetical protein